MQLARLWGPLTCIDMEWVVELTTHTHLEHRLRIGGAIPPPIPNNDYLYLPGYYVFENQDTVLPRPWYFDMPSPFGATLTQILCVLTQLSTVRNAGLKATVNIVSASSVGWIYYPVPGRTLCACPHITSAIGKRSISFVCLSDYIHIKESNSAFRVPHWNLCLTK